MNVSGAVSVAFEAILLFRAERSSGGLQHLFLVSVAFEAILLFRVRTVTAFGYVPMSVSVAFEAILLFRGGWVLAIFGIGLGFSRLRGDSFI